LRATNWGAKETKRTEVIGSHIVFEGLKAAADIIAESQRAGIVDEYVHILRDGGRFHRSFARDVHLKRNGAWISERGQRPRIAGRSIDLRDTGIQHFPHDRGANTTISARHQGDLVG
jgi:hypothetical protein